MELYAVYGPPEVGKNLYFLADSLERVEDDLMFVTKRETVPGKVWHYEDPVGDVTWVVRKMKVRTR
jgi:hypothetical protein